MKYYVGQGRYQHTYETLYQRHVPETGWAGGRSGELLRAVSNLYQAHYGGTLDMSNDQLTYFRYLLLTHFMTRKIAYRVRQLLFYNSIHGKRTKDEEWDWLVDLVVEEVCKLTNTPLEEDVAESEMV